MRSGISPRVFAMILAGAILVSALSALLLTGSSGGALLSWLKGQQKGGSAFDLWHGKPAPNLTIGAWDGRTLQLTDFRGRPVILDFWASWSPPSRANLILLNRFAQAHPEVAVIGIAAEPPATARAFAEPLGITYPLGSVAPERPPPFDQIIAVPTTFLIDASGLIVTVVGGYLDQALLDRWLLPPPGA